MIETTITLWLAMLCTAIGNVWFRRGMLAVGTLASYRPSALLRYFFRAAINPYNILGVIVSTIYFFLWLIVLAKANLSWALPMNAIEYIFITILAIFFLKEKIGWQRWTGIGFIMIGILFLMKSW